LPAAIIIVQHIADGFSGKMAAWLSTACALPVRVALDGDAIAAGSVLVAPDQRQLIIQAKDRVHSTRVDTLIQQPSIDLTMCSAVAMYGRRIIGALLSGVGHDGVEGMLAIRAAGGYTIAQDETSNAASSMPRAAIQRGAIMEILPYTEIGPRLVALTYARSLR
jgi:two-component system chemotaxis response regulator CheB